MTPVSKFQAGPKSPTRRSQRYGDGAQSPRPFQAGPPSRVRVNKYTRTPFSSCSLYLPAGCVGANDALLMVSNFGNIFSR
jgi:hypothetical protein